MRAVFLALAMAAAFVPALPVVAQTPAETSATAAQPRAEIVDGRNTLRFIPPNPRGVIYMFHGSGGSEDFATNLETRRALAPFIAAGYGYAASASLQRDEPRRWDNATDPASNPDIAYMLALHRRLVASGELKEDTPVFAMGMSNGGGFTNLFGAAARAAGLPVKAVADYMGPFPAAMAAASRDGSKPPATFAIAAERDGLVNADNIMAGAQRLRDAGVTVESHLVRESAVAPAVFTSIEGVNAAGAQAIFDSLVAGGIIDAEGKRLVYQGQPVITREHMADLRARLADNEHARPVYMVLMQTWGAHMMRSDFADEQFAFFEAALNR